jgi:hypothetical protein
MMQTMLEKLRYSEEKNLLIQGLPSSIEKQFSKVSFAKNLTPLLRTRRIDFALVFAVNHDQLGSILRDVIPALHECGKLWVAYPRSSSKIVSDLNRDTSWACIMELEYENVEEIGLDHVWNAIRFERAAQVTEAVIAPSVRNQPSAKVAIAMTKEARGMGKVAGRV